METTLKFSAPMFAELTTTELFAVDGGLNGDKLAAGVAAVGTVAALVGLTPVAIVCGLFCAGYWITKAIIS